MESDLSLGTVGNMTNLKKKFKKCSFPSLSDNQDTQTALPNGYNF